nr:hypothetical protein [Tanacetum cinerariifolium]
AIASEQSSSGPALHEMTPTTISSGLVPKPTSSTPFVPPSRNDWDLLFQPLFDELLYPLPSVDPPALEVITLIADFKIIQSVRLLRQRLIKMHHPRVNLIQQQKYSSQLFHKRSYFCSIFINDVKDDNHDIEVAHMGNDLLFGMPIPKVVSDQSSSTVSSHTIVHPDHQIPQHNSK